MLKKDGLEFIQTGTAADYLRNLIKKGEIQLAIITSVKNEAGGNFGFSIRRAAVEYRIPCFTALDTVKAFRDVLLFLRTQHYMDAKALQDLRKYAPYNPELNFAVS
jgi:carbamoyl-phosphate synthase large subunit